MVNYLKKVSILLNSEGGLFNIY